MHYDLIIFDLDGTLIDSFQGIFNAMRHTLALHSVERTDEEITAIIEQAEPLPIALGKLFPNSFADQNAKLSDQYQEYYAEHWHEGTIVFPEVIPTLDALSAVQKAIATSKFRIHAERIIKHLGLDHYFPIVGAFDGTYPAKPDPTVLFCVLAEAGVPAERTLFVGDTDKDICAGQSAGVATCAIAHAMWTPERLRALNPDYVVEKFSEILQIV